MRLVPGQIFAGDFRVERELSRGGMGQVYVATQLSTGRARALKVMRPELAPDESMRKRFDQEAKVGARIQSDHVVEVVAAGVDEATAMPWLAMELLEGESLADKVHREGALAPDVARVILGQLAHALVAAHAVGVVHRDLKPDNVFVASARRAVAEPLVEVLDFGIAKVVAEARATATAPMGTLLWMAPEQADAGAAITPACDVWAFGLIAFYVLTGRTFWDEASSVPTLLKKITLDPIVRASERARELRAETRLPRGFDGWFARAPISTPSPIPPRASRGSRAPSRATRASGRRTIASSPRAPRTGARTSCAPASRSVSPRPRCAPRSTAPSPRASSATSISRSTSARWACPSSS
jgi:serine/threonine protein kinase